MSDTGRAKVNVASGPGFVCIGAQKAGTTWLYDNLVKHPQLRLPPVKEVHFFNLICPNEQLLGIEVDQLPRGVAVLRTMLAQRNMRNLRWLWRFYDPHRNVTWYRRLFDEFADGRVSGDITPAYSTLDDRGVDFVSRVLDPTCRIFVILRNPVERIWSGIKMSYRWKEENIAALSADAIHRDMLEPSNRLRTDYVAILRRWQQRFPDRFRVFLYDDLQENPTGFLHGIEDYIGVDRYVVSATLSVRSNADGKSLQMPMALKSRLLELYQSDIELLERELPSIRGRWSDALT